MRREQIIGELEERIAKGDARAERLLEDLRARRPFEIMTLMALAASIVALTLSVWGIWSS